MEDLDPPRESPEAAVEILRALEILELHWDDEVLYQSQRHAAYQQALQELGSAGQLFPCPCTRQDIRDNEGVYPGTCRQQKLNVHDNPLADFAIRCKVADQDITFTDQIQGEQHQNLHEECGDFIIKRKDGLFAYQLAVVVDDAFQGISHVIRGVDLLDSTARQIHLQKLLGLQQPVYGHIPVIVNTEGQKLSKQHHAAPLDLSSPTLTLYKGLQYLQQALDPELQNSSPTELLHWAIQHWNPANLKNRRQVDEHQ